MAERFPYRIQGDDMQMLEIRLAPGQVVVGEAGAMMYIDSGIEFEAKLGSGGGGGGFMGSLISAGTRMLAGESAFVTQFTNNSAKDQVVAFSSEAPGKILPLDMAEVGGSILAQRDAFLCASPEVTVSVAFQRSLGRGFFGGEGFILQKIEGEGQAFLSAGGMIVERELNNEKVLIDTGCIVAFEPSLRYDVQRAGNIRSMMFGGEGLFLATLEGSGRIWLQSMPVSRLAGHILSKIPTNQ